jgi:hypothetical protein
MNFIHDVGTSRAARCEPQYEQTNINEKNKQNENIITDKMIAALTSLRK